MKKVIFILAIVFSCTIPAMAQERTRLEAFIKSERSSLANDAKKLRELCIAILSQKGTEKEATGKQIDSLIESLAATPDQKQQLRSARQSLKECEGNNSFGGNDAKIAEAKGKIKELESTVRGQFDAKFESSQLIAADQARGLKDASGRSTATAK